jgi:hypothetical protein
VFEGLAFGYELGLLTLKFGPRFTTAKKVLVATWAAATDLYECFACLLLEVSHLHSQLCSYLLLGKYHVKLPRPLYLRLWFPSSILVSESHMAFPIQVVLRSQTQHVSCVHVTLSIGCLHHRTDCPARSICPLGSVGYGCLLAGFGSAQVGH